MEFIIQTPSEFSFRRTALSHGWSKLLPFELNEDQWTLTRVLDIGASKPLTVAVTPHSQGLVVTVPGTPGKRAVAQITAQVKHLLRLDDDMGIFYALLKEEPQLAWVVDAGAGRMLRSPTVFEDLIKTICTTNCSWALTKKMVSSLVQTLGTTAADGRKSFPSPETMAEQDEEFYRTEIRSGYRAGYLKQAAESVAAGELNVEQWLNSDLPTAQLKKEIKMVKGVGDYAAENLLKLLGRYDGLALDSWLRAQFAKAHNRGRTATDKKIERHYARFKEWRGLAMWCDMTKDWIEDQERVSDGHI
jgi:3-methyladenine DNA glycosylase/8-oxoguanine DNA glycosylase